MNYLEYFFSRPIVGRKEEIPMFFGALLFLGGIALWLYYIDTLPPQPDVFLQRTYPLRDHGRVVYATLRQTLLVHGMICAGCFIAGGGIAWEMRNKLRKKAADLQDVNEHA